MAERASKHKKACSECARLKERCDANRPCERCIRVKRPESCADQISGFKRPRSATTNEHEPSPDINHPRPKAPSALIKSNKLEGPACEPCHRRKKKCDRLAPCSRCARQGDSRHCIYPTASSSSTGIAAGELSLISSSNAFVWHSFNLVLDSQPATFDYLSNYKAAYQQLLNLSPLEVMDAIFDMPQHILYLFGGLLGMLLTPTLTEKLLSDIRETIDYNFSDSNHAVSVVQKLGNLSLMQNAPDLSTLPDFTVRPVFEKPNFALINSRNIFAGFPPVELSALEHYLDRFVPPALLPYMKPNTRPACFLIRIGFPVPGQSHPSVTFILNKEAESLFGYTSQELQYSADIRDLQNQWVLHQTGQLPPPGAFL
eukprot:TRINITY_DN5461_c0_g1_i2.p1 TRINITY_DN5461_c0_g1~~TRINITY_DN5461_c0_g1_i2.p1  ORF type:complete len:371 (-),score=48.14 TRINITY_DN5461_c0_g1_i2:394-1506(-)